MADKKTARVCWLTGSYFCRQEKVDAIRKSVGEHELFVYGNDDEADGEHIEEQILSASMFSHNRVVILYDLPDFSSDTNGNYINLFSNVPDDCIVIINGVSSAKKKIFDHVSSIGKVFSFCDYLSASDAFEYITKDFQDRGIGFEDDDIRLIIKLCGEVYKKGIDFDKVYLNMSKITSYIHGAKKVTREDIIKAIEPNSEFIIWEFFDALDERDFNRAQTMIREITVKDGIRETAEYLFSMMVWRYKLLTWLRSSVDSGMKDNEITEFFSAIHKITTVKVGDGKEDATRAEKDKAKFIGARAMYKVSLGDDGKPELLYSSKMIQNTLNAYGRTSAVDKYTIDELSDIIDCIEDCQLKMRSRINDTEILLLFDNIIMTICHMFNKKSLKKLRGLINA